MSNTSVITTYRRKSLCQITSGAVATIPKITHIVFGNGGTDSKGEPIAPVESDTALKNQTARYSIDGVSYPVGTTARYVVTIPLNDMAGEIINEAALVDEAGKLCAIKTMYDKRKDDGVIFTFTFDDEF